MTKNRITYGFKLDFPAQFTLRELRRKRHDLKYITLYKRVEKALKDGIITVVGKQEPKTARRGARQLIYARVNAKVVSVTAAAPEVAPVVAEAVVATP
jgi:hypothetical protein